MRIDFKVLIIATIASFQIASIACQNDSSFKNPSSSSIRNDSSGTLKVFFAAPASTLSTLLASTGANIQSSTSPVHSTAFSPEIPSQTTSFGILATVPPLFVATPSTQAVNPSQALTTLASFASPTSSANGEFSVGGDSLIPILSTSSLGLQAGSSVAPTVINSATRTILAAPSTPALSATPSLAILKLLDSPVSSETISAVSATTTSALNPSLGTVGRAAVKDLVQEVATSTSSYFPTTSPASNGISTTSSVDAPKMNVATQISIALVIVFMIMCISVLIYRAFLDRKLNGSFVAKGESDANLSHSSFNVLPMNTVSQYSVSILESPSTRAPPMFLTHDPRLDALQSRYSNASALSPSSNHLAFNHACMNRETGSYSPHFAPRAYAHQAPYNSRFSADTVRASAVYPTMTGIRHPPPPLNVRISQTSSAFPEDINRSSWMTNNN